MGWIETVFGITSFVFYFFMVVIGMAFVVLGVWYYSYLTSFKHKFRVREVTSDRKRIIDDKFRVVRDKAGVVWWQLLKRKHKVPPAPSDCIDIAIGGSYCVEAYYTEDGEYVYMKDKQKVLEQVKGGFFPLLSNFAKKVFFLDSKAEKEAKVETAFKGKYVYIKDRTDKIEGFQTFTSNQRALLIAQFKKANSRKQSKWTDYIMPVAAAVVLVTVFAMVLIFWEDITKPSLAAMNNMKGISAQQAETTKYLREIIQERQVVEGQNINPRVETPPQ